MQPIALSPTDRDLVEQIAAQRVGHQEKLGLSQSRSVDQRRRDNRLGAAAELTVARLFGTRVFDQWLAERAYWRGGGSHLDAGDVGLAVQVKAKSRRSHNLLIPGDWPNRRVREHVFVSALVYPDLNTVEPIGWIKGRLAMTDDNWDESQARPCWLVPGWQLQPFDPVTFPMEYVQ